MAAMRVQYFQGKSTQWFVRLRDGANGEVLMVSESYGKRKGNAKRAADKLAARIPDAVVEEDNDD